MALTAYERNRRELEKETSEEVWEQKNDALRRLGLRTIPNPGEQSRSDFFASTPLNGLSQYGTIPSDVDLRIGVVVMRRMSFALGGGKRFPPLLYIRHAKEQALLPQASGFRLVAMLNRPFKEKVGSLDLLDEIVSLRHCHREFSFSPCRETAPPHGRWPQV